MAPLSRLFRRTDFLPGASSDEDNAQWSNPSDVFSVLLILGGDVVSKALAQSTGWTIGLPSFSFGWVAYSVNALTAAVGENRLMPRPDYDCLVINGRNAHARQNKSWVIGRLLRDYDHWMTKESRMKVKELIDIKWNREKEVAKKKGRPEPARPTQAGLCVSIYQPSPARPSGKIADSVLVATSLIIAIVQMGIAAIPCGLFGDWSILMITAVGILLTCFTASLRQWEKEKWACRRLLPDRLKNFILTGGNGSQHAIVILGCEGFLDMEDLAGGQTDVSANLSPFTRLAIVFLALLWVLLLVTAAGLKANSWFLLAVGGVGILFNVWVAGRQRSPHASGIPLDFVHVIGDQDVMEALYKVEDAYPRLGSSFLGTYFPGGLRKHEIERWAEYKRRTEKPESTNPSQPFFSKVETEASTEVAVQEALIPAR